MPKLKEYSPLSTRALCFVAVEYKQIGLFIGCSCEIVNHEDDELNEVKGQISANLGRTDNGETRYELTVTKGFAVEKFILEAKNLEPEQPIADDTSLDKVS